MTLKQFNKLSKRDFDNSAVRDEIRTALKALESAAEILDFHHMALGWLANWVHERHENKELPEGLRFACVDAFMQHDEWKDKYRSIFPLPEGAINRPKNNKI